MGANRFGTVAIHGWVAEGFEEVETEFQRNFARRGELGSACAVYFRGERVVDLWGGCRDAARRAPWREDTMVLVFSATKGMAATVMALAHSRGWFELDRPVAAYWPEFAQANKDRITVRQLLAHQAGLPVIDEPLTVANIADLDFMAGVIARQRPAWEPGTRHGYHSFSLGWYENELIRRIDPEHRSLGRFFRDEIAQPQGLEFYIGLPDDVPATRLARIQAPHVWQVVRHIRKLRPTFVLSFCWPWSLAMRTFRNPRLRGPDELDAPEYRRVELPSGNGIGTARAMAKVYGLLAMGGQQLGIHRDTFQALIEPANVPRFGPRDLILKSETAYSMGFFRPSTGIPFGSSPRSFGAPGVSGSIGFADPDVQIGYAYVTNKMGIQVSPDDRDKALRRAMYRCVDRR